MVYCTRENGTSGIEKDNDQREGMTAMHETTETRSLGQLFRLGALTLALILVFHLISPAAGALASREDQGPTPTAPPPGARDYLLLGEEAIAAERYEEALAHLEQAQTLVNPETEGPLLADILIKRVSLLILEGAYPQAVAVIEDYQSQEVYSQEGALPGILEFLKAGCHTQTGDHQKAAQSFQAAMDLGYDKALCLEQLLISRFELGDYEGVLSAGELLLAMEGAVLNDPDLVYRQLGISHVYLGNFEQALEALALAGNIPGQSNGYYRGICLISLNRPQEALEAFTTAIEEGDLTAYSHYNRGVCYLELLEYQLAKTDMEQTLAHSQDPELTAAAQDILRQLEAALDPESTPSNHP